MRVYIEGRVVVGADHKTPYLFKTFNEARAWVIASVPKDLRTLIVIDGGKQ